MYYYSEATMEVDDLIKEFINFRNSKSQPAIQSQKPLEIIKEFLDFDGKPEQLKALLSDTVEQKSVEAEKKSLPLEKESAPVLTTGSGQESMYELYSETNKRLMPYVEQALDSFEFDGSPAFAEHVEKETVTKIVDKAIELAAKNIIEIIDIQREMHRHPWTHTRLLRACVEALTINELSYRRLIILKSTSDIKAYQLL